MDNNLVPVEYAETYKKVSKWDQPGGTLAKIITVVAGCATIYGLYLALPIILSLMTNAFSIACLAIGLWALVSIVTNKKFRRLISTVFFLVCRKLTKLAVETDPISILSRHTKQLRDKIKQISESMGKFRGAIRAMETEKARREAELKKEMELIAAYKEKNMMQDSIVHSNQAVRLKDLISTYENDLKRMNQYYNMLKDLQHYSELKVKDEEFQIDILNSKYKRTRDMYNAFSGVMSVINNDTDDYEEYLMATSYMNEQINAQLGAIDDALLNTDSILNDISIENGVNIGKASGLLDIYEKYGIDGLFMTDDQRKALPDKASGTVPVSQIGITDTDRDLEYATKKREELSNGAQSARKYV